MKVDDIDFIVNQWQENSNRLHITINAGEAMKVEKSRLVIPIRNQQINIFTIIQNIKCI